MKDQLEKFIIDHREAFDSYEPSPEVWQKIARSTDKSIYFRKIRYYAVRVAAILLIAFVSVVVYEKFTARKNQQRITKAESEFVEENIEIAEAENFYRHQVDKLMKELETSYPEFKSVSNDVKIDLQELDKAIEELKIELGNNVNNEEIIVKLIENYRLKLSILEDVLNKLREIKQSENQRNDDKNI